MPQPKPDVELYHPGLDQTVKVFPSQAKHMVLGDWEYIDEQEAPEPEPEDEEDD